MINEEIINKYSEKINFTRIIKADLDEFEAIVDSHLLTQSDLNYINTVSREIYGKEFGLYFYSKSDFNIAFGVYKG